jgi:hypothetical protein
VILLSASQVSRITGVSHWHQAKNLILKQCKHVAKIKRLREIDKVYLVHSTRIFAALNCVHQEDGNVKGCGLIITLWIPVSIH